MKINKLTAYTLAGKSNFIYICTPERLKNDVNGNSRYKVTIIVAGDIREKAQFNQYCHAYTFNVKELCGEEEACRTAIRVFENKVLGY